MEDRSAEFCELATKQLCEFLDRRGQILYTSVRSAYTSSKVIVYGLNPGQNGELAPQDETNCTLRTAIMRLPTQGNLVKEQVWLRGARPYPAGEAPYQQRTLKLLEFAKCADAPVVNLVFFQSTSAEVLANTFGSIAQAAQHCWPVHEWMLEKIRPDVLIVFGSDASRYLCNKTNATEIENVPAGHGKWRIRVYEGKSSTEDRKIFVIQLPHISRYNPDRRSAKDLFARVFG